MDDLIRRVEALRDKYLRWAHDSSYVSDSWCATFAGDLDAILAAAPSREPECQRCHEPANLTLCYECADARVENTIKARGLVPAPTREQAELAHETAVDRILASDHWDGFVPGAHDLAHSLAAILSPSAPRTEPRAIEDRSAEISFTYDETAPSSVVERVARELLLFDDKRAAGHFNADSLYLDEAARLCAIFQGGTP